MRDPNEAPRRRKRKLKINLDDLETAFETDSALAEGYIDLETGQVILITEDIRARHDEVREFMRRHGVGFEEALSRLCLDDWEEPGVRDADRVERDSGDRFVAVPSFPSSASYRDMEAFIETVPDAAVRGQLSQAIRHKGPFRSFKDAIGRHAKVEAAWYAFKQARARQAMIAWLGGEGVEIDAADSPASG
jgi:hypothetical protein